MLLKSYFVASRIEFIPFVIFMFLGFSLFTSLSLSDLFSYSVLLGFIIVLLCNLSASGLNCILDIESDKMDKPHLSNAVLDVGLGRFSAIITIQTCVMIILGSYLAIELKKYLLLSLLLLGLFFGYAYSIEPIKFKRRPFGHAISLSLCVFFLPALFIIHLNGDITTNLFLLVIGFTILQYGQMLLNAMEDYSEDKKSGILNPPVVLGLLKTLKLSFSLVVIGFIILILTLMNMFSEVNKYYVIIVPLLCCGWIYGLIGISKNYFKCKKLKNEEEIEKEMKLLISKLQVAKWAMASPLSLFINSIVLIFIS